MNSGLLCFGSRAFKRFYSVLAPFCLLRLLSAMTHSLSVSLNCVVLLAKKKEEKTKQMEIRANLFSLYRSAFENKGERKEKHNAT